MVRFLLINSSPVVRLMMLPEGSAKLIVSPEAADVADDVAIAIAR